MTAATLPGLSFRGGHERTLFVVGSHASVGRESGQAGNRAAISVTDVVRGQPGHLFSMYNVKWRMNNGGKSWQNGI